MLNLSRFARLMMMVRVASSSRRVLQTPKMILPIMLTARIRETSSKK